MGKMIHNNDEHWAMRLADWLGDITEPYFWLLLIVMAIVVILGAILLAMIFIAGNIVT